MGGAFIRAGAFIRRNTKFGTFMLYNIIIPTAYEECQEYIVFVFPFVRLYICLPVHQ